MAKKHYYDISSMLATKAQYMILLGQRSNGKSYQAKMTVLTNAYKNKRKFVYLRRWKEDIKQKSTETDLTDGTEFSERRRGAAHRPALYRRRTQKRDRGPAARRRGHRGGRRFLPLYCGALRLRQKLFDPDHPKLCDG